MNIIQVIGGPGAGKGAISSALSRLWPRHATHLRTNRYWRDRKPGDGPDFLMLPSSIDWPLVHLHIEALARGERVIMPDYDWRAGRRLPPRPAQTANLSLQPTDLLLLDSLFLAPFTLDSARVFVDAPLEHRRQTITTQDAEFDSDFIAQFDKITEPGFQERIAPQRAQCDLVLDGTLPAEQLAEQARQYLLTLWGGWG